MNNPEVAQQALWTVPTGTSYLILIGVGIEPSFMFAIAGLVLAKLLPEDPKMNFLGVNNPHRIRSGECCLLCHRRNLPCPDPGFRLGLRLVGCHPGLLLGLYSFLPGSISLPRLETPQSDHPHQYTFRDRSCSLDHFHRVAGMDIKWPR